MVSCSGCSNIHTSEGLMWSDLSKLICASVYGKPSSTKPFTRQSLCLRRTSMRGMTTDSGTREPSSRHFWIRCANSGRCLISALMRVRVHTCTRPKRLEMILAYVDLPEPGGPKRITRGGLLGASFLYLILSIRARSFATSFWSLSLASYS